MRDKCGYSGGETCQHLYGLGRACSGYGFDCRFYSHGVELTRLAKNVKTLVEKTTGIRPDKS